MLNRWIINIVSIAIFATIIEMILMEDRIKKYIDFFIGLIIIIAILQPISHLIRRTTTLETNGLFKVEEWNIDGGSNNKFQNSNNHHIVALYKKNLENDISQRIQRYFPDSGIWPVVIIKENDGHDLPSIDMIHVTIGISKNSKVQPVIISSTAQDIDNSGAMDNKIMKVIKNDISRAYEIEESRIYITIEP